VIDLALPSRLTRPFGYDHVQVVVDSDADRGGPRTGYGRLGLLTYRALHVGRLAVEFSTWRRP
jgi:hypothetical protein